MSKLYYRIAHEETQQGLWYDSKGNFTGLIHNEFNFCMNKNLPMPFDPDLVGWLSATDSLEDLFNWFSKEDIERLENDINNKELSLTKYKYILEQLGDIKC